MFIRIEKLKSNRYLIIDEIERVIGTIEDEDLYDCLLTDETFEEDEYTYFSVDKECILEKILK